MPVTQETSRRVSPPSGETREIQRRERVSLVPQMTFHQRARMSGLPGGTLIYKEGLKDAHE